MTTATAPILAQLVADRWTQATYAPRRFEGEHGLGVDTSELYDRLTGALEEYAAVLFPSCEMSADTRERLDLVVETLVEHIGAQLRAFAIAEQIPTD